ncbi:EutP/PduV family microcompartment system protein [Cohnella suwonensis]|uniref:EutP/PduV family microcompartment system protein n=1 Tax=Cohnella suwonensis TaxID=696072 RepID=A0ABW0LVG6_9BACL
MGGIMVIGPVAAGKSSLIRALSARDESVLKTQSLIFYGDYIDTPGEYTENPLFYRSLMATAQQASAMLLVQDATRRGIGFPPGFAGGFPVPAAGAATKLDDPAADPERAVALLRQALPVGDIVLTSSATGMGISELRALLERLAARAK